MKKVYKVYAKNPNWDLGLDLHYTVDSIEEAKEKRRHLQNHRFVNVCYKKRNTHTKNN